MRVRTAAWSAAAVLCGCMAPMLAEAGVVVAIAPPAPVVEVVPAVPAPGYVWRPGYWTWSGRAYVWVAGRYVIAPRSGAAWVPGHWVARGGGWVWSAGHWRR